MGIIGLSDPLSDREVLFAELVREVNIEISDFCNRLCPYCPYEAKKRGDAHNFDVQILRNLLIDLARIGYDKSINFHLYNEPFHDIGFFFEAYRIRREILPKAKTYISSNGDYINADLMRSIIASEVEQICVTIHYKRVWDRDDQAALVRKFIGKVGLPLAAEVHDNHIMADGVFGVTRVIVRSINFEQHGTDRGGSLEEGISKAVRQRPCFLPQWQINVNSEGEIYPCCNIYPRANKSAEYRVGDLKKTSIFDAYFSDEYQSFLKAVTSINSGQSDMPECCKGCTEDR